MFVMSFLLSGRTKKAGSTPGNAVAKPACCSPPSGLICLAFYHNHNVNLPEETFEHLQPRSRPCPKTRTINTTTTLGLGKCRSKLAPPTNP